MRTAYDILAELDTHGLALTAGVIAYLVATDESGTLLAGQWAIDWQFAVYRLFWQREVRS